MIKIDDWVIEKGEKAQGKIKITGYGIAMPATVICGVKDGPITPHVMISFLDT